jgi:X-X-X-Leu-X-X-Gly heptad repeat protein
MTHAQTGQPQPTRHGVADNDGQGAQTVGEQTRRVVEETGKQAKDLWQEGRQQLAEQAKQGQRKAASGLHTLADQLDQLHDGSDDSDLGPKIIKQAAEQTRQAASWLERRQPGDLLDEVRAFARRKPGVFLAGAALAGVLLGRLTRGVVATTQDDDEHEEPAPQPDPPSFQAVNPAVAPPGYPPQMQPPYPVPPAPAYGQPPAQVPPAYGQQPPGYLPPPWQPGPEEARP